MNTNKSWQTQTLKTNTILSDEQQRKKRKREKKTSQRNNTSGADSPAHRV